MTDVSRTLIFVTHPPTMEIAHRPHIRDPDGIVVSLGTTARWYVEATDAEDRLRLLRRLRDTCQEAIDRAGGGHEP